ARLRGRGRPRDRPPRSRGDPLRRQLQARPRRQAGQGARARLLAADPAPPPLLPRLQRGHGRTRLEPPRARLRRRLRRLRILAPSRDLVSAERWRRRRVLEARTLLFRSWESSRAAEAYRKNRGGRGGSANSAVLLGLRAT